MLKKRVNGMSMADELELVNCIQIDQCCVCDARVFMQAQVMHSTPLAQDMLHFSLAFAKQKFAKDVRTMTAI